MSDRRIHVDKHDPPQGRHVGLEWLRILSVFAVVHLHAGEFFYIGNQSPLPNDQWIALGGAGAWWAGVYGSPLRACVPLFVMLSGYFLFPVEHNLLSFFSKRLQRVVAPFVCWCIVYALSGWGQGAYDGWTALRNVAHIPLNYGTEVGHLWFVYMLLGVYLFSPLVSPWVTSASQGHMQAYLGVWGITLCTPYLRMLYPKLWGEAYWNNTPMLHYFSGFLGYAICGYYIRRFHGARSTPAHSMVAWSLVVLGSASTAYGFLHRLDRGMRLSEVELSWTFESINVAMVSVGTFMVFKDLGTGTRMMSGNRTRAGTGRGGGGVDEDRGEQALVGGASGSPARSRGRDRQPSRGRSRSRGRAGIASAPGLGHAPSGRTSPSVGQAGMMDRLALGLSRLSYGVFLSHILLLVPIQEYISPKLGNAGLTIPVVAVLTFILTNAALYCVTWVPGTWRLTGVPPPRASR